jgi:hypothetical protein
MQDDRQRLTEEVEALKVCFACACRVAHAEASAFIDTAAAADGAASIERHANEWIFERTRTHERRCRAAPE